MILFFFSQDCVVLTKNENDYLGLIICPVSKASTPPDSAPPQISHKKGVAEAAGLLVSSS